jgi:hypothetical protein
MHERIPVNSKRVLHRKRSAKPTFLLIEVRSSLLCLSETVSFTHNAIVSPTKGICRYLRV